MCVKLICTPRGTGQERKEGELYLLVKVCTELDSCTYVQTRCYCKSTNKHQTQFQLDTRLALQLICSICADYGKGSAADRNAKQKACTATCRDTRRIQRMGARAHASYDAIAVCIR